MKEINRITDGVFEGCQFGDGPIFWYDPQDEEAEDKAMNRAFEWGDCLRTMGHLKLWSDTTRQLEEARA